MVHRAYLLDLTMLQWFGSKDGKDGSKLMLPFIQTDRFDLFIYNIHIFYMHIIYVPLNICVVKRFFVSSHSTTVKYLFDLIP